MTQDLDLDLAAFLEEQRRDADVRALLDDGFDVTYVYKIPVPRPLAVLRRGSAVHPALRAAAALELRRRRALIEAAGDGRDKD